MYNTTVQNTSYQLRSGPAPVQFRNDGGRTVQRSTVTYICKLSSPEAERPVIAALKNTTV